jgi:hydrogenase maturation factor
MCTSEAALVLSVEGDEAALVDLRGSPQRVPLILVTSAGEKVVPGDWLLVSTGLAITRISEAEAIEYRTIREPGVDNA